jgi:hypothetical protein
MFSAWLAHGRATTPATLSYRTMNKHRLQLTDDTKSPIAMAGRLIILAMGEICPDRYVSRDWRRDLLRPMK